MSLMLVYDFETQSLPLFHEPSEDPRQPHIVELGAILVDTASRRTVSTLNVIVKPEGWTIPEETTAIHGISTERALEVGVPERLAVRMLFSMWASGRRVRVAHNEQFDARIMRIALMRHANTEMADEWKAGPRECTATMAAPIVNLPPTANMVRAGFKKPKTPTLSEAYRHFMGRDFDGAHSALADATACKDIYFAMQDLQAQPQQAAA